MNARDAILVRMAVWDATSQRLRSPETALVVADRKGAIRIATPGAAALFAEMAETGQSILPLLQEVGIDPMALAGTDESGTVYAARLQQRLYHCRLLRTSGRRTHAWFLVLTALPPVTRLPTAESGTASELAATAAHEIRNPLTTVSGIIQELQLTHPHLEREYTDVALRELDRVNALLTDLMTLTAPYDSPRERIDLRSVAREVAVACEAALAARGQRIALSLPSSAVVCTGSADALHQVLLNLLRNAGDASPVGSPIDVEVSREGGYCVIKVLDRGEGFPPGILPHIFKPFFTTKHGGTGLGLAVCRRIVTAHRGTISAFNRLEGGGGVVIRLPAQS